jgi:hypothetical protein
MKIEFSPTSRSQLDVLIETKSKETGFIFGFNMGQYKIIDSFFPLRFNRSSLNRIYPRIFNRFGDRLIGVFFINDPVFMSDWFLEQMIVEVRDQNTEIYMCRFDDGFHQKRLIPVAEERRG